MLPGEFPTNVKPRRSRNQRPGRVSREWVLRGRFLEAWCFKDQDPDLAHLKMEAALLEFVADPALSDYFSRVRSLAGVHND